MSPPPKSAGEIASSASAKNERVQASDADWLRRLRTPAQTQSLSEDIQHKKALIAHLQSAQSGDARSVDVRRARVARRELVFKKTLEDELQQIGKTAFLSAYAGRYDLVFRVWSQQLLSESPKLTIATETSFEAFQNALLEIVRHLEGNNQAIENIETSRNSLGESEELWYSALQLDKDDGRTEIKRLEESLKSAKLRAELHACTSDEKNFLLLQFREALFRDALQQEPEQRTLTQPLYENRTKRTSPIDYFNDHYADVENLYADELHRHDPALYAALSQRMSKNKRAGIAPNKLSDLMLMREGARGGGMIHGPLTPEAAVARIQRHREQNRTAMRKSRSKPSPK